MGALVALRVLGINDAMFGTVQILRMGFFNFYVWGSVLSYFGSRCFKLHPGHILFPIQ